MPEAVLPRPHEISTCSLETAGDLCISALSIAFYADEAHFGSNDQGVIGLVVEQVGSARPEFKDLSLDVSRVVPGSYIRDTIAQLPEIPPSETISR
jgi:hypothetical protein